MTANPDVQNLPRRDREFCYSPSAIRATPSPETFATRPPTTYHCSLYARHTRGHPVFLNRSNRIRFIKRLRFQFALNHVWSGVPTEGNRLCAGACDLDVTFTPNARTPNRGRHQRWICTPQQSESGHDGYQGKQSVPSRPVPGDYATPMFVARSASEHGANATRWNPSADNAQRPGRSRTSSISSRIRRLSPWKLRCEAWTSALASRRSQASVCLASRRVGA